MEIDKCNSIDELDPYPEKTNNMYNNDDYKINSAFVKIPIINTSFTNCINTMILLIVQHFNHLYQN